MNSLSIVEIYIVPNSELQSLLSGKNFRAVKGWKIPLGQAS